MSARKLIIHRSAKKRLRKFPLRLHERMIETLTVIEKNPLIGAKLGGELSLFRKYRVGDYRIVYRFDKKKKIVVVVKIEHRRGVYR